MEPMKKRSAGTKIEAKKGILVGVRIDRGDGHERVSRGDDFVAVGGTKEGHEHLRETVAEISDEVKRRKRNLAEVRREELKEIVARAIDKVGPAPE
jgi:hypothetical protein